MELLLDDNPQGETLLSLECEGSMDVQSQHRYPMMDLDVRICTVASRRVCIGYDFEEALQALSTLPRQAFRREIIRDLCSM